MRADDFLKEIQSISQMKKTEIERHSENMAGINEKLKRLTGMKPEGLITTESVTELIIAIFKRIGISNEKFL